MCTDESFTIRPEKHIKVNKVQLFYVAWKESLVNASHLKSTYKQDYNAYFRTETSNYYGFVMFHSLRKAPE